MINKELIQENKWMREKLSSLCIELMALSVDTETILSYRLTVAPDKISIIAAGYMICLNVFQRKDLNETNQVWGASPHVPG